MSEQGLKWSVSEYQSGTIVVSAGKPLDLPNFYVQGKNQNERRVIARQLNKWLNGGQYPDWSITEENKDCVTFSNGCYIYASGPVYDAANGGCHWVERTDVDAKLYRWELINAIREKRPIRYRDNLTAIRGTV